jgi:phosphoribosylamine---glycine ligase
MEKHKVLLIGSGGRECALAWKLAQSPLLDRLYIAPGNAGTAAYGINISIPATDIEHLCDFAVTEHITFVLVGPDDPLALGIVDAFRALSIPVFGPTQSAAQLEWSKAFAKEIMTDAHVPTAAYTTCTSYEEAHAYCESQALPLVIKASGLALGKGVYICASREEITEALTEIMVNKVHKGAGDTVVIEQFITGREISAHAITDGVTTHIFPAAQDHKRIGENNTGKNTGGMGTIAPLPWLQANITEHIKKNIIDATLACMDARGTRFTGCLFPGLMIAADGPYTLEFNARFGDPETQVYMRLLDSDALELLYACATERLATTAPQWSAQYAANIVIASGGYPDAYEKGKVITGIDAAERIPGVVVFHAGTNMKDGLLVTNGGRVLGVSAVGATLKEALERAYQGVSCISFEKMYYRTDIGQQSLTQQ